MKVPLFAAAIVDLSTVHFTRELLECIPVEVAHKYRVMPVDDTPFRLAIAVADAGDLNTIDALTHIVTREMEIRVADQSQLDKYIRRYYGRGEF
jgi:type II secretory ATPase GspE/PulE/Tfp pilus assembly ATPase PilB-like protein